MIELLFAFVFFYMLVSGFVWVIMYAKTPSSMRDEVHKHWIKSVLKSMAWPIRLITEG